MGAADGTVEAHTKIVDHGPDEDMWNLVIMGDGFSTADEVNLWYDTASDFVGFLQTVSAEPLSALVTWESINVHLIRVVSNESGVDKVNCVGASVDTYFDSTLCTNGITRLLTGDDGLVITTAQAQVPNWDAVVVFVNTTVYGGGAGMDSGVAWASLDDPSRIALHELGHAAFNLADEYCDVAGIYSGSEPLSPNATIATTLAGLKWRDLVTSPNAVIPTMTNPDTTGSTCDPSLTTVPLGTIGTFEGAMGFAVGVYRPDYACLMNTLDETFCAVCREAVLGRIIVEPKDGAGPCWVATVAYADSHHPDVEALRSWRDRRLAAGSRSMQLLVTGYARVGPVLARFTASRPWLSRVLRTVVLHPWAMTLRRRSGWVS